MMNTSNAASQSEIVKSIWLKSVQINKRLNNSLSFVHGIGLSEYMVLDSLMNAPKQTLSRIDLAESIGRTASAITKMLAPMEKIGLVEKQAGARDARVSLVRLTDAGERIFQEASASLEQSAESILGNLDSNQRLSLMELLRSLGS